MWRSILNSLLNTVLLILLYWHEKSTPWFENKLKDASIILLSIIIPAIITWCTSHFKRQLALTVQQKNKATGEDKTQYHQGVSGQKQRTIELEIKLKRTKGMNWFINRYLRNKRLLLNIECNPPGLELQAKDEELLSEVIPKSDRSGFSIDITEYVKSVAAYKADAEPFKEYFFFIKETKDSKGYFNSNMRIYINPTLTIGEAKKAAKWLLFALSWQPDQHTIDYYHNSEEVK
ncbi:hypothetical protein ACQKLN_29385 [Paenibacillus glucanolyticus]|uniref:hypothetical protein n=1 Tax=Paenibacillus glucanolyticus TaxID=59843 RepID=UPI00369446C0